MHKVYEINLIGVLNGNSFVGSIIGLGPKSHVTCDLHNFNTPKIVSPDRDRAYKAKEFLASIFNIFEAKYYIYPIEILDNGRCSVVLVRQRDNITININTLMRKMFK